MEQPYRLASSLPLEPESSYARSGLVRANGSRCMCCPPGRLWCWWHEVQLGERWDCRHGGRWIRWRNLAEMDRWQPDARRKGYVWSLSFIHPMNDVFSLLGWKKRALTDRNEWTPPEEEES